LIAPRVSEISGASPALGEPTRSAAVVIKNVAREKADRPEGRICPAARQAVSTPHSRLRRDGLIVVAQGCAAISRATASRCVMERSLPINF